jgi:hypothetical protein
MLHAAAQPERYGYYSINTVFTLSYTATPCDSRAQAEDGDTPINAIDGRDSGTGGLAGIGKVSELRRLGVVTVIFCTTGHGFDGQGYLPLSRPY